MTMWLNPGGSKHKNPFEEKAKQAKETLDIEFNPTPEYANSLLNPTLSSSNQTNRLTPQIQSTIPNFAQSIIEGAKDYATNPKKLFSEVGLGLSTGLSKTGAVKQDIKAANILANNPLMKNFAQSQLGKAQKQQEYLQNNPVKTVPAMLGEQIPQIPLWMAGEGFVNAAGKGLTKLAPSLRPLAEKATRLPGIVKGGLTDAAAYGTVVAPVESYNAGDTFSEFIDREKNIPGVFLGGTLARGAFKGIGEGAKLGNDIARNSGSLKQALAERKLSYPELKANPLDDVQNAYKAPSLLDVQNRDLQRNAVKYNIGPDRTPKPINPLSSPERNALQGDLQKLFNDLPNQGKYSFTTGEQRALSELQEGIQKAQDYIGHTDVLAAYNPGTTIEQAYADIAKNTGIDLPQLVTNWEKTQSRITKLTPGQRDLGRSAGVLPSLAPRKSLAQLVDREAIKPKLSAPLPKAEPRVWTNREGIQSAGLLPRLQPRTITPGNLGPKLPTSAKVNLPLGQGINSNGLNPLKQSPLPLGPSRIEQPLKGQLNPPFSQSVSSLQSTNKLTIPNTALTPRALQGSFKSIPTTEPVGLKRLSFPDTVGKGNLTNPKLTEQINRTELNYGNITNKDTLEVARKFIQEDKEAALHLVMADTPATAESNAVAQLLIKEANDTGKFDQAISIIEKTASKAKTQGQAIQALSMWGRLSPEGVLKYAENTIGKSRTPKQVADIDNATKNLADAMGKINSQVVENVVKEVESGLGPKLSNKPKKRVTKAPKLSDDIIKKLDEFEASARQRLAESKGRLNSLPVDILADYAVIGTVKIARGAVKFSAWSADMLKEFGDEIKPHLTKIWDQSLKGYDDFARVNGIRDIESELAQVNRSVSQGLKDMELSIGDIVRQHYSVGNKVQGDLVTRLIEKAGLSGEDAAMLEKHILNRMTELTQAKKEQILNQMFRPRLGRNQKEVSVKIIELSNLGGLQNQQYRSLVGEKLGVPMLDETTAKSIYEQSNKIQTMTEGREKQVAIAKMLDSIAAKIPPSMLQKIGTLQTIAQLLNPKTAIRNVVGNLGFAGMENVSNTLGAGLDKGLGLFTNQRTRTLPSLSTQLKGFKEGFGLGLEDAVKGINTSSIKTQFDLSPTKTFRSGILGKLETAMNIELRATDRAFYKAAYEDSLRSQMKAAKVAEPTEAMKEIADHDGLYKTFQDTNAISSFFSGFKQLLNDPVHFMGKAGDREPLAFGIGDFVLKYPKTPGNLLARGIDYSPAGFVKVVMEAAKPLMGKEFNQRAFVDAFSRAIVGTGGLVGTGALLHRTGIISGKPDSDYDVAALNRQVGLGEYKVNVSALKRFVLNGLNPAAAKLQKGDTLISYDWFQPQALPLAMGADIDKNGAKAQGIVGTVLNGLATGTNTFADQPVMQGVSSLFGQRDFSDGITKIMQGVPASFVPTFLNQVKQLLDNQKRNTYSPNWTEKTTNLAASKIPIIEKRLQPTYDALGNKVETYQNGSNNPLNVFLNPAFVSKYSPSKEAELALNAYNQTGETKQIPTIIPKYFTVTGQRFDLTPGEYSNMQRIVGENTQKAFGNISSMKTDKQIQEMAKAIEKARLEGKKAILNGRRVPYVQSGNTLKLK